MRDTQWAGLMGTLAANGALLCVLVGASRSGVSLQPEEEPVSITIIRPGPRHPVLTLHRHAASFVAPTAIFAPDPPTLMLPVELLGPPTETSESMEALRQVVTDVQPDPRDAYACDVVPRSTMRSWPIGVNVLVGLDGYVREVELPAAVPVALKNTLSRCAMNWGPFPVTIMDGRVVESWRLIEWAPSNT